MLTLPVSTIIYSALFALRMATWYLYSSKNFQPTFFSDAPSFFTTLVFFLLHHLPLVKYHIFPLNLCMSSTETPSLLIFKQWQRVKCMNWLAGTNLPLLVNDSIQDHVFLQDGGPATRQFNKYSAMWSTPTTPLFVRNPAPLGRYFFSWPIKSTNSTPNKSSIESNKR